MHPTDRLWLDLCDLHIPMRLAALHALEDAELRPEDELTLDRVPALRQRYQVLAADPDVRRTDEIFLGELDTMLSSLEGRAEAYRLAICSPHESSH